MYSGPSPRITERRIPQKLLTDRLHATVYELDPPQTAQTFDGHSFHAR